jgi:MFS transporter, DHA1 family, multidrug resistance protein
VGLIFVPALALLPSSGLAPHPASAPPKDPPSWRRLLRNRPCWAAGSSPSEAASAWASSSPLPPCICKDQGLSVGASGWCSRLQAAVNALSRIPCGRLSDRLGRRWDQAIVGFVLLGMALAAFGWAHNLLQFSAGRRCIWASPWAWGLPRWGPSSPRWSPQDRGLAMGGYNTCIYLSMMLSSAIMGGVIHWIGFTGGYLLSGAVVILSAGGFYLLIRNFSGSRG